MKKWADQNRRPLEFQPGDLVLIKLTPEQIRFRGNKDKRLVRKYEGPTAVISKVGKVSYKVELPAWMKMHPVFHVSRLKPYHADKLDPARSLSTREEIKEQSRKKKARDVEEILAERKVGGRRRHQKEYLVKWRHLGEEEISWERAEDLEQFKQQIEDFQANLSSQQQQQQLSINNAAED